MAVDGLARLMSQWEKRRGERIGRLAGSLYATKRNTRQNRTIVDTFYCCFCRLAGKGVTIAIAALPKFSCEGMRLSPRPTRHPADWQGAAFSGSALLPLHSFTATSLRTCDS
jgi:hypothetical protein